MTVTFFDRQDRQNRLNGIVIREPAAIASLLESLTGRAPFLCELVGANGKNLLLGVGGGFGCAQYSPSDGSPPYLMAVAADSSQSNGYIDFLTGGTPTPISKGYCLTPDMTQKVAQHFVATGERYPDIMWEEI
jgi:hypothetical protein